MQRTILVPIDFSDCAMDVVRAAVAQASCSSAGLLLLHVIHLPPGVGPHARVHLGNSSSAMKASQYLMDEASARMPAYLQAAAARGLQVTHRIEEGAPADTILAVADDVQPSLIVMGTHARAGIARLMFGSVAEQVRQDARHPVLVVPTEHESTCKASSCDWCDTHVTEAEKALAGERDG